MLQDWACKAEAGPTIIWGSMDPQRDRQDGHQVPQDESGFLERLSRRAHNRESRSLARSAQAANSAAAARAAAAAVRDGHKFRVRRFFPPILVRQQARFIL